MLRISIERMAEIGVIVMANTNHICLLTLSRWNKT